MTRRSFKDALAVGRSGEYTIASELEDRGWFVIPSYEYTGKGGNKAPKMTCGGSSYAVPDLDISKGGVRLWVEVKTKTEATLHRKTNTLEHGMDKRLWESYAKVQDETGCPVYVCIVELSTGARLVAGLDTLKKHARYGVGGGSNMVYFPRAVFVNGLPE